MPAATPTALTPEAILSLAPDPGSAKNARALATPAKWPGLHTAEGVLWGECQGSGSHPYLTGVDLSDLVAKCSCPSRKFPCKHALALLLLYAARPGDFSAAAPPEALSKWLAGRAERAEQAASTPAEAATPSPAAQTKRRDARERKVTDGLEGLSLFLRDLVRGGLAAAQGRPYKDWDSAAARLVDAQAPGAARLVRETPALLADPDLLLAHLGRLHLLCTAWTRRDILTPEEAAEVRTALGFPLDSAEVLATPGVTADWTVLGQANTQEDHLSLRRSWLLGADRLALLLDFAPPGRPLPPGLPVGARVQATLHFPVTALPVRALLAGEARVGSAARPALPPRGLDDLLNEHARQLALNPWLERSAGHLSGVRLAPGEPWQVVDAGGRALPVTGDERALFRLQALGGGRPMTLFGEWDGRTFAPLTLWETHD